MMFLMQTRILEKVICVDQLQLIQQMLASRQLAGGTSYGDHNSDFKPQTISYLAQYAYY
jgi:hypothetical protein